MIISAVGLPYDLSQGTLVRIGVSVGIAERDLDASDSQALLASADRALYAAKKQGKGTFYRAPPARKDGDRISKHISA